MKPPKQPMKKTPSPLAVFLATAFGRPWRWLTLSVLTACILGAGWWYGWRTVRERVLAGKAYRVTAEDIYLSPAPPWIHSHIRDEVLSRMNAPGDSFALVDDDLCPRLADEFALHPWVLRVVEVRKSYPARVDIKLEYRQPVAMVEVPAGPDEVPDADRDTAAAAAAGGTGDAATMLSVVTTGGGLLPIDAQAVLLPTADFSRAEARRYPRIGGIGYLPPGPAGTTWGDPRVAGAAEIAALLIDDWQKLGLYQIRPSIAAGTGSLHDEPAFELWTRDGTRVIWGWRPATDLAGEVSAGEKHARLREQLTRAEAPDATSPNVTAPTDAAPRLDIDIRYSGGVTSTPQTAALPDVKWR
ncbi:MAG: cell division protein FtsQ/DivIB [Pirellulales bacterium]